MKLANNTTITQRAGFTCVTLYHTDVVAFNDKEVRLCTGGHVTAVTARRMNDAAKAFALGFKVTRKDGAMVCRVYNGKEYTFTSELTFNRY